MQSFAERFAHLALEVIRTESPHCYDHQAPTPRPSTGGAPLTPKTLHPAFYGCYDWHSAVHSHWLLAELLGKQPTGDPRWRLDPTLAEQVKETLLERLSPRNLELEHRFLTEHRRFERPYGLAWMLNLCRSLGSVPALAEACAACEPAEELCASRLFEWLTTLPYPIRTGEHGQSAFALALLIQWARQRSPSHAHRRAIEIARRHHAADRLAAFHLEPSGNDFLSPGLGAAYILSEALESDEFARFCNDYFPRGASRGDSGGEVLRPVSCPDPGDGKLAHLSGLNLSRGWMLARISARLTPGDLQERLWDWAEAHRERGLEECACEDLVRDPQAAPRVLARLLPFSLSHWVGSFALLMEDALRPRWPSTDAT